MSRWDDDFAASLAGRDRLGLRRYARAGAPAAGMQLVRDGRALLNFSSNDYLGLARDPRLSARAAEWGARYGTGATASRLVCGTLAAHQVVEAKIAALKGTQAALVLASGWQANVSVLAALLRLTPTPPVVFADALIHSSLHHGVRGAGCRAVLFGHNDLADLREKLGTHRGARAVILTESVFSMDGDRADVQALRALADEFAAFLYVDEAHATGVLGDGGRGLCHAVPGGVDLVMGTFSKALGGFGAYVAGSQVLIDWLTNMCAGFIYTTALPPTVLGAIDAALDVLPSLDGARARVALHAARVRAAFTGLGIDTAGSSTQIVPALVGGEAATLALAEALRARGVLGVAIRPPTVPAGTSRIRFALSAAHDDAAVDTLISAMADIWPARAAA